MAGPVFIFPKFMIHIFKLSSMHYWLSQCLCHETIAAEPKLYLFLNRRVFIKSRDKCILKVPVFVYVSVP